VKILGIDHISVATDDIGKHRDIFKKIFGIDGQPAGENRSNKVSISFLDFGYIDIELIEPLDSESPISKFLQKRGPGIHHICVLIENLDQALKELQEKNIGMIDAQSRIGAEGSRIAFIHPDSTGGVLIELKEKK